MKYRRRVIDSHHNLGGVCGDPAGRVLPAGRAGPLEDVPPTPTLEELGVEPTDGVDGEMVITLWLAAPELLLMLYQGCLREGYFPVEWKEPRFLDLLKPPEEPKADPRSYRPICLLSALGNALEAILVASLGSLGVLSEEQYGFVKGKSVETALERVMECVSSNGSAYVLGVFVDFRA